MSFDVVDIVQSVGSDLQMAPVHLSRGSFVEDAISSGSLTYDLITGGGFPPGRVILLKGFEASGKTTFCYSAIRDAIAKGTIAVFIDAEGSADTLYMGRIGIDVDKDCGVANKDGTWKIKPKLLFEQPDTGEQVFRFIKRTLERMPDKVKDTKGNWRYVYADGTEEKAERGVEVLFFVDSLAALVPEDMAEDDTKSPTAMQARMFSENLRMVKSLISQKKATLIETNQMRINPRQMYGNPKYMPGGEAVKHYCDVRVEFTRISVPGGSGPIEEEPCWDGLGIDRYVYVKLYTDKNKAFSPFRGSVLRIWFEERGQPGRGIDPVYDVWQYLIETGQGTVDRGNYKIKTPFLEENFKWADFKKLVLDPKSEIDIRAECRKQVEDGSAFPLYFDTIGQVNTIHNVKVLVCSECKHFGVCKKDYKVKSNQPACEDFEEQKDAAQDKGSLNLDKKA